MRLPSAPWGVASTIKPVGQLDVSAVLCRSVSTDTTLGAPDVSRTSHR